MWRVFFFLVSVVGVGAQGVAVVDTPEDAAILLDVQEDAVGEANYHLRWRLRGWQGLKSYQRGGWIGERQEIFVQVERDVGEPWSDYISFYYKRELAKGQWLVGDLRPGFGMGLVFGRGRGGGVPARASARDSRRLGYRSSTENGAVRGAAWRQSRGKWQWVLLGGTAFLDARVDGEDRVTSLPMSGLHVSATERNGRDLLRAKVGGLRLRRDGRRGHLGLVVQGIGFSHVLDLRRRGRTPWAFVGARQVLLAVDGRWRSGRMVLDAEVGSDVAGRWAAIAQVQTRWARARWRLLGRYYAPGLHSFFGAAPGASGMQNELGVTALVENRSWRLYIDGYRRPQRSYFIAVAALYATWGGGGRWRWAGWDGRVLWQGKWRPRWKAEQLWNDRSRRLRLDIERGNWTLQAQGLRLFLSGRQNEWGRALALRWRLRRAWGSATLHGSQYHTNSYASRLYEYEYDVPGTVSVRPLYGEGWRLYALISLRWLGSDLAVRYRLQRDRRTRHDVALQIERSLRR